MSDNDPILTAIRAERTKLEARLATLNYAERKLTGKTPRSAFQLVHRKTPTGEIRAAQLAKLKGAGWLTSAKLKRAVIDAKLLARVNSQVWTSSLRKLVGDGIVEKNANGPFSEYRMRHS